MLEKTIQKNILKYLKSLDGCIAENVQGSAGAAGRPDINACYKGRCYRIEVKTRDHGRKVTPLQDKNLRDWANAGAICFVAYSLGDVKALINEGDFLHWQDFDGDMYSSEGVLDTCARCGIAPAQAVDIPWCVTCRIGGKDAKKKTKSKN